MKSQIEKSGLFLTLILFMSCAAMLTACSHSWPESLEKKQEILAHTAGVLHSSIDTNQISLILVKLTNQPEIALAFQDFANRIISDISEWAALLTDPKLKTYVGEFRGASIPNPHDPKFSFEYIISGPQNLVQQIDEFPSASTVARKLKSSANFYQNGKLRWYKILKLHEEFISFTDMGEFGGCDFWLKDGKHVSVSADGTGHLVIPPTQNTHAAEPRAMPEHASQMTNLEPGISYAQMTDRLVARLSSDHSWESGGYLAPDWLDVTNPVKQVIPRLLEWDSKVKTSHILYMQNVQIQGSSLPNPYVIALVDTDEGMKAVLLNGTCLGTPPYHWVWRVFDEWSWPHDEGKTVRTNVYERK